MAVNTGKIQGKHREFNLNLNVATQLQRKRYLFRGKYNVDHRMD